MTKSSKVPFSVSSAGATAPTRYVGGTATGAPTTGTFVVGDFAIAQNGNVWICTAGGTPGTWTNAGSGATAANVVTSANATANRLTVLATSPATPAVGDLWADTTTVALTATSVAATTVVNETGYGQAAIVGTDGNFAREGHSHGTPALPTTGAIGAVDLTTTQAIGGAKTFTSLLGGSAGITITGAEFNFQGAGTADVNANRLFGNTGNIYIQPGSGSVVFRSATGNSVATISQAGLLSAVTLDVGTSKFSVDAAGSVRLTNNTYGFHYNDAGSTVGRMVVYSDSAASVLGIFRGITGQTGNLTEWQNATPGTLAKMDKDAVFHANNTYLGDVFSSAYGGMGAAHLGVRSTVATNIVAIFRGATGQSANLSEWHNATPSQVAAVTAGGAFVSSSGTPFYLQSIGAGTYNQTVIYHGASGLIFDRARTTDAVGGTPVNLDFTTRGGSGSTAMMRYTSAYTLQIIAAPSGQGTNLQEWMSSAPAIVARVTADGSMIAPSFTSPAGNIAFYSDAASDPSALIRAGGASLTALSVRGHPTNAQTGYLMHFQNSTGTVGYLTGSAQEFRLNTNTASTGGGIEGPVFYSQGRTWSSVAGDSMMTAGIGATSISPNAAPPTTGLGFYVQNVTAFNGPINRVGYITNIGALVVHYLGMDYNGNAVLNSCIQAYVVDANQVQLLAGPDSATYKTWRALGYNSTSGRDTKANIKDLDAGLDVVLKMRPRKYTRPDHPEIGEKDGFVAEELGAIYPRGVSFNPATGTADAIDYGAITPILVKAIQDLTARLAALELRV